MREQIFAGELRPGATLPPQAWLKTHYGVSGNTVQGAIELLRHDGYLETRARSGTFVAEFPPHLCHYGLIFPHIVSSSRLWTTMREAARVVGASEQRRITTYGWHPGGAEARANRQLMTDVVRHRVAGLVITWMTDDYVSTPVLDQPDMPRVFIASRLAAPEHQPVVGLDYKSFLDQALDHLVARGRRRIALLGLGPMHEGESFKPFFHRRDLETRPYWTQLLGASHLDAAHSVAHLLLSTAPKDRPDGLIIADDNIADHAIAGVVASGVAVPADLDIVAHANFPWHDRPALPVTRLGFDSHRLIHTCIDMLNAQRRGRPTPAMTLIPAEFEDQVLNRGDASIPSPVSHPVSIE